MGDGLGDHRLNRGFVGHIGAQVNGALTERLNLAQHVLGGLVEHIGDDNIAPGLGQAQCRRCANAACAAGHNRHPSFCGGSKT